ncbi:MAG: hypothetical protein Fur0010_25740 [Bdellovibrio sp.]
MPLPDGRRIDLFIAQNPATIIEFGMGEVLSKKDQILGYFKELRTNYHYSDFNNIIVGSSYEGNSTSREIDINNKLRFINWIDFFSLILDENEIVDDYFKRGA